MSNILNRINEAKDVSVYKKLVNNLNTFSEKFPLTGIDSLLDAAVNKGKSILPKDKRALSILKHIAEIEPFSASVSALLNTRFADLPTDLKPLAKIDRRGQLAFWNANGKITDLVKDLLNFTDTKAAGFFCDVEGKKVTLLDTEEDKKK